MPAYPCPLSQRDLELMRELMDGRTYEEASARLGVPVSTLRKAATRLFDKLGVRNATAAAAMIVRNGWDVEDGDVPPPSPGMRERLGLDREGPLWWLSENTGDDPLSRLIEDMAVAEPAMPRNLLADRLAANRARV